MTITILTGLPGAGKSETLITRVNAARRTGRTAHTFMCSESPTLRARHNLTELREMRCRSGLKTRLSHFVSTERAIELLAEAPVGALLAFDEALHFGDGLVFSWCEAAGRGAEILIASPSMSQIEALERQGHIATLLRLLCQRCKRTEASRFFLYVDENRTESVCDDCYALLCGDAERAIVDLLLGGNPRPGEQWLIQPVELPQCASWSVVRRDSRQRLQTVIDTCARAGLPRAHSTYLDFGCRTGFFCSGMAAAGFNATGIDPAIDEIRVARLLSTYGRQDAANYRLLDIQQFLSADESTFDVITAFGISEWKQWQDDARQAFDCLRKLFRAAGRFCILEAIRVRHDGSNGAAVEPFDRSCLVDLMNADGGFDRIDHICGERYNLQHDLLVGEKVPR